MNVSTLVFSVGVPEDAPVAAELIYDSDPPYYDFWLGSRVEALQVLQRLWRLPAGAYCAANMMLVRDAAVPVALYSAYPAEREPELSSQTEQALVSVCAADAPAVMARDAQLAYLFPHLPQQSWYLRTLCVASSCRGAGLGERILAHISHEARRHGHTLLLTDVDSGNQGAVRFYQRAGFEILVETKVNRLLPYHLPASLRMAKHLNQDR